jgi:hypothetical protein
MFTYYALSDGNYDTPLLFSIIYDIFNKKTCIKGGVMPLLV